MPEKTNIPEIAPEEVASRLGTANFYVIDNNKERVWKRVHIPGAKNLDPFDFEERDLPADKEAVLVFYCSDEDCGMAPGGAKRAMQMGYKNVYLMSKGIKGWKAEGLPVEKEDTE